MALPKKVVTSVLLSAVALSAVLPLAASLRAKDPAATAAGARDDADIIADIRAASVDMRGAIQSPKDLLDEAKRKEAAPKLAPPLKKLEALFRELAAAKPEMKDELRGQRYQMLTLLSLLGDADTNKALDAAAKGDDKAEALAAKMARSLASYWLTKDPAEQVKLVDAVAAVGVDNAGKSAARDTLTMMANMGAANADVKDKAVAAVDALNGVGRPIELAGKTVDGKDFSTKDLKGKVILVDFWATWCGPCVAELPRVKEIYKKYHDKGFEIVGVSCDGSGTTLAEFTKKEDMPWTQLWDKDKQSEASQWHPLAKEWGVDGIPTMFLIDRNGTLRTMEARSNMEEMIPKLLAEKPKDEKAGATGAATTPATNATITGKDGNVVMDDGHGNKVEAKQVEIKGTGR